MPDGAGWERLGDEDEAATRQDGHGRAKQRAYTDYDAGILQQQGVRPKLHNYILQPWRQFWWRFVSLKGYRDGLHGLRLSLYMGYYEWVKYCKLAALWRDGAKG